MKIKYNSYLIRENMRGWCIFLIKDGLDVSDFYGKHDDFRNTKKPVFIVFDSDIEPPDFIQWDYEDGSDCYT